MKHQGMTAAVIALLAALLVGSLAQAQPNDDVATQLRKLREDLDALKLRVDLDRQVMRDKLTDIDAKLDRLLAGTPTTARKPNAQEATVKLDNRLGVTATVMIDGTPYSVAPLTTRTIRQPAGNFTYSLTAEGFTASTPARQRSLGVNETWTLTIY